MSNLRRGLETGTAILVTGAAIHLCMLLSLQLGFLNSLFDDAVHRSGQGVDFFSVVQSGRNLLDSVNIYSLDPIRQIVPYYNPFRYHPFMAYSVGLLSSLVRPEIAYILWIFIQEIVLGVNLFFTRKIFPDSRSAITAMSMWLLFTPYYLELYMGQFSFLMASLMFWTIAAWIQGRDRNAAVFWICSLVVKSNSVLFTPALLKTRRWKTVVMAGAISIGLAVPYFVLVPGSVEDFLRNITASTTAPTLFGNQGFSAFIGVALLRFNGLWSDFAQEFASRVETMNDLMALPLLLWSVLVVGVATVITVRSPRNAFVPLILLWILAYFLFYKHVWEHQYVMMIPVLVLLYHQMRVRVLQLSPRIFWTAFAVIALPTVFVFIDVVPVLFDPELAWRTWESFAFHAPKPLAVLTLFIFLARQLWNNDGEKHSTIVTGVS